MEQTEKKKGRPKGSRNKGGEVAAAVQQKVVETIKEVFVLKEIEVPQKQLEGFELYKALKNAGMFQGGIGQFMEDVNGIETVYLPHASEIYAQFAQDPNGWDVIRDYLARAFIELKHETH